MARPPLPTRPEQEKVILCSNSSKNTRIRSFSGCPPSVYIFKTQIENLKRQDPDFPLENVCFCAYAKLMCCTKTQLAETPSYIILDKFHRTGVGHWNRKTVWIRFLRIILRTSRANILCSAPTRNICFAGKVCPWQMGQTAAVCPPEIRKEQGRFVTGTHCLAECHWNAVGET